MIPRHAAAAWGPAAIAVLALLPLAASCSTRSTAPMTADPDAGSSVDAAVGADATDAGGPETPDVGPDARVVREFDLGKEFSATVDPTGVWRFGYSTDATLDTFSLEAVAIEVGNIHFWHPGSDFAGYYPYVAGNATNATTTDASKSWAVRQDQLALEGSNTGQYAIVQFVAPDAAVYRVQADFEGLHFNLSTTDVHVRRGATALFDALIDGYGGDPAFHAVVGASPRQSYQGAVALAAGDTLAFAIGYGANRTYNNDTTGLSVHIQELQ